MNTNSARALLRDFRFAEAAEQVRLLLHRNTNPEGEDWKADATELLRERPIYPSRGVAEASEPFYLAMHAALREKGNSALLARADDNLAMLWTSIGKHGQAAEIRERQYRELQRSAAPDDSRLLIARDQLAILYRNAGQFEKAAAIYTHPGICAHLIPVLAALLRDHGACIVSVCRPWSDNCHIWVYLDQVLDCEALLASCRTDGGTLFIHDHRGTHDGAERGLVCREHDDAVMGKYPF